MGLKDARAFGPKNSAPSFVPFCKNDFIRGFIPFYMLSAFFSIKPPLNPAGCKPVAGGFTQ